MGDLSSHFDRAEFRCRGRFLQGHLAHQTIVHPELVAALERLRAQLGGRPINVVSGHRCQWYNARIGGASKSQHITGSAVDLPPGLATIAQARAAGFRGIGSKGPWAVHVDVRPRYARWEY